LLTWTSIASRVRGGSAIHLVLGAGSAWLLLPKRGRDVLLGGLAVATGAAGGGGGAMTRETLALHAQAVLEHELGRAHGRLATLPDEGRRSVEQASAEVTAALVDTLLREAGREPTLADALASIYEPDRRWDGRAALWVAD
jgi:hypothetical protein